MYGNSGPASDCAMVPGTTREETLARLVSQASVPADQPQPSHTGARYCSEKVESAFFDFQPEKTDGEPYVHIPAITVSDFVRCKFLPEYVEIKRPASQAHFRSILKFLISPMHSPMEGAGGFGDKKVKGYRRRHWPYIGSCLLGDIDEERVRHLVHVVLESGYSIQTATHIRNVIRAIFSHAINAHCYVGTNPALPVELPAMARKETHVLSLPQIKHLIPAMRYPERNIALLALLTDMNVAEICGLQWQFVNISPNGRLIEGEWIPRNTVAVRMQFYRGEFGAVTAGRKRSIPLPETLSSMLRDLKTRRRFTEPVDFVVASRIGTPVHPENIAARRLKALGRAHDIPWLSWSSFRRARIRFKSELGLRLETEVSHHGGARLMTR